MIQAGDKIKIYSSINGVVKHKVLRREGEWIISQREGDPLDREYRSHEKQCRKLVAKRKRSTVEKLAELVKVQANSAHIDEYMRGMYNGMECLMSCIEAREANFMGPQDAKARREAQTGSPAPIASVQVAEGKAV